MRLSWANCCFFALHALLMLRVRDDFDRRVHMHGALWLWKTLVWAGAQMQTSGHPAGVKRMDIQHGLGPAP